MKYKPVWITVDLQHVFMWAIVIFFGAIVFGYLIHAIRDPDGPHKADLSPLLLFTMFLVFFAYLLGYLR